MSRWGLNGSIACDYKAMTRVGSDASPTARESSCPALPLTHIGLICKWCSRLIIVIEEIKLSEERKMEAAENINPLCFRLECVWCVLLYLEIFLERVDHNIKICLFYTSFEKGF